MSARQFIRGPNFTLERGDLLEAPRIYDRAGPPRLRPLVQAIRFALFSPYGRWRYA